LFNYFFIIIHTKEHPCCSANQPATTPHYYYNINAGYSGTNRASDSSEKNHDVKKILIFYFGCNDDDMINDEICSTRSRQADQPASQPASQPTTQPQQQQPI
jgi:hypothetical protein